MQNLSLKVVGSEGRGTATLSCCPSKPVAGEVSGVAEADSGGGGGGGGGSGVEDSVFASRGSVAILCLWPYIYKARYDCVIPVAETCVRTRNARRRRALSRLLRFVYKISGRVEDSATSFSEELT